METTVRDDNLTEEDDNLEEVNNNLMEENGSLIEEDDLLYSDKSNMCNSILSKINKSKSNCSSFNADDNESGSKSNVAINDISTGDESLNNNPSSDNGKLPNDDELLNEKNKIINGKILKINDGSSSCNFDLSYYIESVCGSHVYLADNEFKCFNSGSFFKDKKYFFELNSGKESFPNFNKQENNKIEVYHIINKKTKEKKIFLVFENEQLSKMIKKNSKETLCRCSRCKRSNISKIFYVPKYCGCLKKNRVGSKEVNKKTKEYLEFISC